MFKEVANLNGKNGSGTVKTVLTVPLTAPLGSPLLCSLLQVFLLYCTADCTKLAWWQTENTRAINVVPVSMGLLSAVFCLQLA